MVRTAFVNVLKLDITALGKVHNKSILLCSCIHVHVMSVPTSFYRTFASSPKADPVSFKLVLALLYNYPKIEGKADRTAKCR